MVLELYREVTVMQRSHHLFHEILEFFVSNVILLVKSLELRKEGSIVLVPVKTVLLLIIPQRIVDVQRFPEHAVFPGKAILRLAKGQFIVVGITHDNIVLLVTRCSANQRQEHES